MEENYSKQEVSSFQNFDLQLNAAGMDFLKGASKWAAFLAILGFIGIGFMLLGSIVMLVAGDFMGTNSIVMSIMYIIMTALYFFPVYFLYKFSSAALKAVNLRDSLKLSEAIRYLKSHYMYLGISAILIFVMYVGLIMVVGIGLGASQFI